MADPKNPMGGIKGGRRLVTFSNGTLKWFVTYIAKCRWVRAPGSATDNNKMNAYNSIIIHPKDQA